MSNAGWAETALAEFASRSTTMATSWAARIAAPEADTL
jgi:hypothetical protein